MFNYSFTPSPPIGQWRVLVPEAAFLQGSPAYSVSPPIHDKPTRESDLGEEYTNDHADQDNKQSAMGKWFKQNLSWVPRNHLTSSTSRYPDAPDAQPTITATDGAGE